MRWLSKWNCFLADNHKEIQQKFRKAHNLPKLQIMQASAKKNIPCLVNKLRNGWNILHLSFNQNQQRTPKKMISGIRWTSKQMAFSGLISNPARWPRRLEAAENGNLKKTVKISTFSLQLPLFFLQFCVFFCNFLAFPSPACQRRKVTALQNGYVTIDSYSAATACALGCSPAHRFHRARFQ